jgi:hypothetical protein
MKRSALNPSTKLLKRTAIARAIASRLKHSRRR